MVDRHDGFVGVVFLMCLARIVFGGGANRARDVFAIHAFADDDEDVVHLTVVDPWPALLDPGGHEAVRVIVERVRVRGLVAAETNMGLRHEVLLLGGVIDACNRRK